jgi:hypothetical protein
MFPAYFRHEIPESVFSSMELRDFLLRVLQPQEDGRKQQVFFDELGSLEKGSVKRDDFLRKLSTAGASASVAEPSLRWPGFGRVTAQPAIPVRLNIPHTLSAWMMRLSLPNYKGQGSGVFCKNPFVENGWLGGVCGFPPNAR